MNLLEKIEESRQYIRSIYKEEIEVAVILGSGLGTLASKIDRACTIAYSDIPNFPPSTVDGHKGELIIGNLEGKTILAFNGRFHYYEGHNMVASTIHIRLAKALGVKTLIVSNAAGGMNPSFEAGDLMVITDHINMMGANPLIGENFEELGARFPDMSNAYSRDLRSKFKAISNRENIRVVDGVYAAITGPNYETPAELKMLRIIGGDAVGMSTVPEVIVANHAGIDVLGISVITDMALWDKVVSLKHEDVMKTAAKATDKFIKLIELFIREL